MMARAQTSMDYTVVTFNEALYTVVFVFPDIDECSVLSPCDHDGSCTNLNGSYTCNCTEGWNGTNCKEGANLYYNFWFSCWSSAFIRRIIYRFLNVCPFDYTAFAVSWKVWIPQTGLTTPVGWLSLPQLTVLSRSAVVV